MNPILQALSPQRQSFNGSPADARTKVLAMIDRMDPRQRASLAKMLPTIGKVAQAKGVDTSALSELQARM